MRVAAFRDQLVYNAVVSDVVEPPDALLPAEIADRLVHLRDLRRRRGDPVIQRDDDLLRVPDLHRADLVERKQGQREHLVHVQQVDVPVDDLSGAHGLGVARAREDLLRHRLARHRDRWMHRCGGTYKHGHGRP